MRGKINHFRINEILIFTIGKVFRKILQILNYDKCLTVKNEINTLLHLKAKIKRRKDLVTISNLSDYSNFKFSLRLLTSDKSVFEQVIINREYQPIIDLIQNKGDENSIKYIIDAGSNIGLTSLFFNKIFPDSEIISIEPDKQNFKYLSINVLINKLNTKIIPLNRALWVNCTDILALGNDFRDGNYWSKNVRLSSKPNKASVKSVTLQGIIDNYMKTKIVDILKMDIEGSEAILFKSNDFIKVLKQHVRYFCLEIHDEFNIRDHIRHVLLENNFEYTEIGETSYCYNKNLN